MGQQASAQGQQGTEENPNNPEVAWWCKLLAKVCGAIAGGGEANDCVQCTDVYYREVSDCRNDNIIIERSLRHFATPLLLSSCYCMSLYCPFTLTLANHSYCSMLITPPPPTHRQLRPSIEVFELCSQQIDDAKFDFRLILCRLYFPFV